MRAPRRPTDHRVLPSRHHRLPVWPSNLPMPNSCEESGIPTPQRCPSFISALVATWLLTVTHHKAVDAVRKESAIRRRTVAAPEAGEDWSPTPVPGADQAAMARVAAGQVHAALHRLPVEQRQALALAYFGGHTQREIAIQTGVPLGTVKSRMFAAVQRLRVLLTDQLDPDVLVAEARRARGR